MEKIKVTYSLPASTLRQLDKRSSNASVKKSETLDSDLAAFWAIMREGQKALEKVSSDEQEALKDLFKAKSIRGGELLVWASAGLLAVVQDRIGKGSLLGKLKKMSLLERAAILDWLRHGAENC